MNPKDIQLIIDGLKDQGPALAPLIIWILIGLLVAVVGMAITLMVLSFKVGQYVKDSELRLKELEKLTPLTHEHETAIGIINMELEIS